MSRIDLIKMFGNEDAKTFNKCSKAYEQGREDERTKTIDEFESRILSNCSMMYKDSERAIVIRSDIFKFIIEQMKGGAE